MPAPRSSPYRGPGTIFLLLLWAAFVPASWGAGPDCEVWWNDVLHDTFSGDYREPGGAVPAGSTVRLRLRVTQGDVTSVRVRVWDDRTDTEIFHALSWDEAFDTDPVNYDWWSVDLPVGDLPTILYYFFEISDDGSGGSCTGNGGQKDTDYYGDDDPNFRGGGTGRMLEERDDFASFQITVYDPAFSVPEWMRRGVVYQVFVDRFRDGDPTNDTPAGTFHYGGGTIQRSGPENNPEGAWNYPICDPRGLVAPACVDRWSDNFYGGDLAGITAKIDQGYFDNLGVDLLYLTPIFSSPSNHKYDTADYLAIDAAFGTRDDFLALATAAHAHGMRLILDGVFNHSSSDSRYFDYYCRYAADGTRSSEGENCLTGKDGSGACEATGSPQRSWYFFSDTDPVPNPGGGGAALCEDIPPGRTYEAWAGYGSLPKLRSADPGVRDLIWADGLSSAGPYWTEQGADGWRLDVGGEVDCGVTCEPDNDFWEGFRAAVRDAAVTGKSDVLVLGEEWGDASRWLLGDEWDAVMNYRLRSALLGWMFTGCAGPGCSGGTVFEDNDSNDQSPLGAIRALAPSDFDARLRMIAEDYPPPALEAMMNLAGSHDTNRLRFLLGKINGDDDLAARRRTKEWWNIVFSYPGAPTFYYGDEVGLSQDGVWDGRWQDDPYNRAPFPWDDASGNAFSADTEELLAHARKLASLRHGFPALARGGIHHGLIVDDDAGLYGFGRTGPGVALIALNRSGSMQTAVFEGLDAPPFDLPDGTAMLDGLSGTTYLVSAGTLSVPVEGRWAAILLEESVLDTPAAAGGLDLRDETADVEVVWSPVTTDIAGDRELATRYQVHRGAGPGFVPTEATRLATVLPPPFGDPEGKIRLVDPGAAGQVHYYIVRSFNAAGRFSDSPEFSPEVCDGADNDADGTTDDLPLPPGPVGASLRLSREAAPEAVVLEWQGAARADRYGVYRSPDAQDVYDPSHFIAETSETRYRDLPPSGAIFFYLVSSRDSCGGENSR